MRPIPLARMKLTAGGVLPVLLTLLLLLTFIGAQLTHHLDIEYEKDLLEIEEKLRKAIDKYDPSIEPSTDPEPYGDVQIPDSYGATVTHTFFEMDTSQPNVYQFNITGLQPTETVLQAELFLYIRKFPEENCSTTSEPPEVLVNVYQILGNKSVDFPELHKLLVSKKISANDTEYQVFKVKRAVLSWLKGKANRGFLVRVTNSLDQKVSVQFYRGTAELGKQPILVLYNDINKRSRITAKSTNESLQKCLAYIEQRHSHVGGRLQTIGTDVSASTQNGVPH